VNGKSGPCVSAAKQHPHRPSISPALGLRAGIHALSLYRRPQVERSIIVKAELLGVKQED
jgi:hypothetical protein